MVAPFFDALVNMGVDPAIVQIIIAQFAKVEFYGQILQDLNIKLKKVALQVEGLG